MSAGARLPHTPEPMHRWPGGGGIMLAGDSWGDPAGPLVVLQHGGGQTRHSWKGAGRALGSAGYHTVALDARGHGDSEWAPDGNYSEDVLVDDLVGVLAAIGARRPVLVGASMGGATSLVAVGEGRVDAAAVVLVDIAPAVELDGVARIKAFMTARADGFESLEEVADAIASYQPHRQQSSRIAGLAKNVRLGDDGRYRWHWDPQLRVRDIDLAEHEARMAAAARRLTIPTLLVRGGLSDIVSEEGAQAFLALCPRAEYANVSGAGHMIAGDRNDVFTAAVIEFVAHVAPTASTHPDASL